MRPATEPQKHDKDHRGEPDLANMFSAPLLSMAISIGPNILGAYLSRLYFGLSPAVAACRLQIQKAMLPRLTSASAILETPL